jgi:predicted enzyme related to lactoylglutathione lyase
MNFVSIRIITGDVARLVEFYQRVTGVQASWASEDFAELRTTSATLAIASTRTVPLFAPGSAHPADNRSVILEFLVDDVDRAHQDLTGFVTDFVNEPTTMPWGNRSLLFRDPDGNLVNLFTPVTAAAIASRHQSAGSAASSGAGARPEEAVQ